jgi:ABC-type branched-subunit amino acid transport system ATPase component
MAILEIENLKAGYGRIEVLHSISLRLQEHSLCAIVGANGAGKTTLLAALSCMIPIREGRVTFDGRDITRATSHAVVRAGLVQVPEGRRMLAGMSVQRGTSILLVEQNARKALALADYAYVLERGTIALEGKGADLLGREEITAAYLGEAAP